MDLTKLANQLEGLHKIVAMITKTPEIMISTEESKNLATGITEVMKYHEITVNPKWIAYGNLFMVCASIYGPRLFILSRKGKQKKAESAQQGQPAGIVFPPENQMNPPQQGKMVFQ